GGGGGGSGGDNKFVKRGSWSTLTLSQARQVCQKGSATIDKALLKSKSCHQDLSCHYLQVRGQIPLGEWNSTLSRDRGGGSSEIPCRRMRSGSYIKAMGDEDSEDSEDSPKPSPKNVEPQLDRKQKQPPNDCTMNSIWFSENVAPHLHPSENGLSRGCSVLQGDFEGLWSSQQSVGSLLQLSSCLPSLRELSSNRSLDNLDCIGAPPSSPFQRWEDEDFSPDSNTLGKNSCNSQVRKHLPDTRGSVEISLSARAALLKQVSNAARGKAGPQTHKPQTQTRAEGSDITMTSSLYSFCHISVSQSINVGEEMLMVLYISVHSGNNVTASTIKSSELCPCVAHVFPMCCSHVAHEFPMCCSRVAYVLPMSCPNVAHVFQARELEGSRQYEETSESVFSEADSQAVEALDLPLPTCFRSRSHSYLRAIQAGCSQDEDTASVGSESPPPSATTVRTYSISTIEGLIQLSSLAGREKLGVRAQGGSWQRSARVGASTCITTCKKTPPPVPPRTTSKPFISVTVQSSTESAQDIYLDGQDRKSEANSQSGLSNSSDSLDSTRANSLAKGSPALPPVAAPRDPPPSGTPPAEPQHDTLKSNRGTLTAEEARPEPVPKRKLSSIGIQVDCIQPVQKEEVPVLTRFQSIGVQVEDGWEADRWFCSRFEDVFLEAAFHSMSASAINHLSDRLGMTGSCCGIEPKAVNLSFSLLAAGAVCATSCVLRPQNSALGRPISLGHIFTRDDIFRRNALRFLMTTESRDLNILGHEDSRRLEGERPLLAPLTPLPAAALASPQEVSHPGTDQAPTAELQLGRSGSMASRPADADALDPALDPSSLPPPEPWLENAVNSGAPSGVAPPGGPACLRDGYWFLKLLQAETGRMEGWCRQMEQETKDNQLSEEVLGKIRSAVGSAQLLMSQKFQQFRGLCEQNLNVNANPRPTAQDLAGFWDLLQLSIEDISMKFDELYHLKTNDWQLADAMDRKEEKKQPPPVPKKPSKPKAASGRDKGDPSSDKQRQEARKRLMAAKRAASVRQNSATESADSIEIYVPEAQTRL
ncbi:DLGP4 protein, partial [Atractosteus spatula]|nr:DLGP4 protein [Atractosteus spatula]